MCEICSLFIIEGLYSVNLDEFGEEFGDIRFFLTFVGKHRFVSAGTRSPVTIEEQDSSGFCTEFTHDDFGDGRLSYTLHLRSYRSEDSCKALSLYSKNLLIPVYKLLNGNRFIRAGQEEDGHLNRRN